MTAEPELADLLDDAGAAAQQPPLTAGLAVALGMFVAADDGFNTLARSLSSMRALQAWSPVKKSAASVAPA